MMGDVPIPPPVLDLLAAWSTDKGVYPFNIDRQEAGNIHNKIPENFDPFNIFPDDDY
jgi:hypothetical protein